MTQLKTLKDLKWFEPTISGEFPDFEFYLEERCGCDEPIGEKSDIFNSPEINGKKLVVIDDLRQAGIEHYKFNQWLIDENKRNSTGQGYTNRIKLEGQQELIQTFFNLTKEDLK